MILHIDFETRSTIELPAVGIDVYSKHPTTGVWCMAFALDDEPVRLIDLHGKMWTCGAGPANGPSLLEHFTGVSEVNKFVENGGLVVAHNASFELAIWNSIMVPRYGWPVLRPEQVRCTMAQAYAMALPGSLEKAAAAVGIKEQKDLAGGRLMLQMARPRSYLAPAPGERDNTPVPVWWDEPAKLAVLYEYCKQDVRVERELDKRLMQLSPTEQRVWQLDYRINQRGFHVDRPAIKAAIEVVQHEKARLDADLRRVTGNFVGFATENARLTQWLVSRGVDTDSVAKAEILDLLAEAALPDDCRAALLIRQEAGKSSMAKLDKILTAVSEDGRLRNTLAYHAASTGRWAGRRVQPHNFPRPKIKQAAIESILDLLPGQVCDAGAEATAAYLDNTYGAPLDVLPWCLRGIITAAPGHDLLGTDFSNVEGRGLAWLAGEEPKLDAFRAYDAGTGPDIYLVAAARIWGREFTEHDPERQHGKVAELACGYQGGVGAFQTMAKTYGVKVEDTLAAEIKERWRAAHPAIVRYWPALEDAVLSAVQSDAIIATGPAGRQVRFARRGSFLWCQLPSGRVLCYPYPEIRAVETPWGAMKDQLTYMTVLAADAKKKGKVIPDPSNRNDWARVSTYGGMLAENITQAICRDLLAEAMLRVEDAGAPIVLHVHDEIIAEVPAGKGSVEVFGQLVRQLPAWAAGLPIAAKPWRAKRYGKHD